MAKEKFNPIQEVTDDGLHIGEKPVGEWSKEKWRLLGRYADMFSNSMKGKWTTVYIDLYSGSGYARMRDTRKIFLSSPMIALSVPFKFHKYIFCDIDNKNATALKARAQRDFHYCDVTVLTGDANEIVEQVLKELDKFANNKWFLPFCFVDPYSLGHHFNTIRRLATSPIVKGKMDFLILQALQMDANRNYEPYISEVNNKIELYLNNKNWRTDMPNGGYQPKDFMKFLADQYNRNMVQLGYLDVPQYHLIKNMEKNVSLYYLAYYTKHELGHKFFKEAEKGSSDQTSLF